MINAILSWGGFVLLFLGIQLIGDKKLIGFYITLVAELMWIGWGVRTDAWALVAMSVALMAMYIRNIWLWGKTINDMDPNADEDDDDTLNEQML